MGNCGKFELQDDKIVNQLTGKPIPDDEPVMIFRGRDPHVVPMLNYYISLSEDSDHRDALMVRREHFMLFAESNRARMKEPDTGSRPGPKYEVQSGRIHNLLTGRPVPEDEPVLILRARDINAIEAMLFYNAQCKDRSQGSSVNHAVREFKAWQAMEYEQVKAPDSEGELPKL